ncbi:MAG: HEAT repeat domain-containing protein [Rhizobacter sp.]|nr:HEAT repeat domain-containing protein [Chlorobiales bacterium]
MHHFSRTPSLPVALRTLFRFTAVSLALPLTLCLSLIAGCGSSKESVTVVSDPQLVEPEPNFGGGAAGSLSIPEQQTRARKFDLLHTKISMGFDWTAKAINAEAELKLVPLSDNFTTVELDAGDMIISGISLAPNQPLPVASTSAAAQPSKPAKTSKQKSAKTRKAIDKPKLVLAPAATPTILEYPALAFDTTGEGLSIKLGRVVGVSDTLTLRITYRATPKNRGLIFITPSAEFPDKPYQIWTQGESEDTRYWVPTYDAPNDKATSEILATVGDSMVTSSNGRLISSVKNGNGTRTDHWLQDKPHSTYLLTFIAGDFKIIEDGWTNKSGRRIPVQYYLTPKNEKYARLIYGQTPDMMDWFSKKIGYDYPWDKYAQIAVSDFTAGGMENTSATTMYEYIEIDDRAALDYPMTSLIAHELAHQWWGDLVTAKDWSNLTLNEGFATFFEAAYFEKGVSYPDMQNEFLGMGRKYFSAVRGGRNRPIVSRRFRKPDDMFDVFTYEKGGLALRMLRYTLGEENFWRVMNAYIRKHQFQNVELIDLEKAVSETTGENLQWFFDQWFRQQGHPEFEVTHTFDAAAKQVNVRLRQMQQGTGFKTPVEIEAVMPDGSRSQVRVMIESADATVKMPVPAEPKYVVLDKNAFILKTVKYPQRTASDWTNILLTSDAMPARAEAADTLRNYLIGADTKLEVNFIVRDALVQALKNDAYWGVRKMAATALAKANPDAASKAALIAALNDKSSRVRTESALSLTGYNGEDAADALMKVAQTDSSYAAVKAALTTLCAVDSVNAYTFITPFLEQNSYRNLIRRGVLDGYAVLGDRRAMNAALKYAARGNDDATRSAAITALSEMATASDEAAMNMLIAAVADKKTSGFVAYTATRALISLKPKSALPKLKALLASTDDFVRKQNTQKIIDAIEGGDAKKN